MRVDMTTRKVRNLCLTRKVHVKAKHNTQCNNTACNTHWSNPVWLGVTRPPFDSKGLQRTEESQTLASHSFAILCKSNVSKHGHKQFPQIITPLNTNSKKIKRSSATIPSFPQIKEKKEQVCEAAAQKSNLMKCKLEIL